MRRLVTALAFTGLALAALLLPATTASTVDHATAATAIEYGL